MQTNRKTSGSKANSTISVQASTAKRLLFGSRQQKATQTRPVQCDVFAGLSDSIEDYERNPSNQANDDDEVHKKDVFENLNAQPRLNTQHLSAGTLDLPHTIQENTSEDFDDDTQGWQVAKGKDKPNGHTQIVGPVWGRRINNALSAANRRTGKTINASGYTAPRTVDARNYAIQGRTHFTGATIFDGINIRDLRVGTIVHHSDLRECHDKDAMEKGNELFKSPDGQMILRKGRYFVVTKVCEFHLNETPLYTYGKKGILEKKSERVKAQHVGVRPLHVSAKQYQKQNKYPPLEVAQMNDPREVLHEKTVLHFVEQRSTPFDTPMRIVGHLTPDSIERLRKLRADAAC